MTLKTGDLRPNLAAFQFRHSAARWPRTLAVAPPASPVDTPSPWRIGPRQGPWFQTSPSWCSDWTWGDGLRLWAPWVGAGFFQVVSVTRFDLFHFVSFVQCLFKIYLLPITKHPVFWKYYCFMTPEMAYACEVRIGLSIFQWIMVNPTFSTCLNKEINQWMHLGYWATRPKHRAIHPSCASKHLQSSHPKPPNSSKMLWTVNYGYPEPSEGQCPPTIPYKPIQSTALRLLQRPGLKATGAAPWLCGRPWLSWVAANWARGRRKITFLDLFEVRADMIQHN